jgi:two-component system LytT family response regulator
VRIVIVDDEPFARDELKYLLSLQPDAEVVAEASDGLSAVEIIEATRPDLVLLDIQMPGLNGFEILRTLNLEQMPQFIFITAYDQFAVRAFEVSAIDYLLKPVSEERFAQALERYRKTLAVQNNNSAIEQLKNLLSSLPNQQTYARTLVGRKRERIFLIPVANIFAVEMESQMVYIVTEKERYWSNETLSGIESRLNPEEFMRTHRQSIVRIDAISELEPLLNERMLLKLKNGHEVTASRNHLSEIRRKLGL